ncbi:carboxypeptidase-like regulatory domain-containing protein [Labilibaculum sp. DW002]|uniref:Carboxypeptidase-like regulatory domain-containing protein n=1 Tax=Paralabilibaculum antarcticum TaxID=2912572 RepID=A0ABT5VSL5_9BACT|nr:carboxypeptidase-like regulatory domain-containing protein [Labilibaculum sp. DW002]MDE5418414.1 carboxypeptidase-like regulatory domain-containing protein [Labilibaculum sp. DW002]
MKLNKLIFISFFLFLTSSFDSFSKPTELDSIISISGQIIHADSLSPIPLATVSIKRTKKGIICDSLGIFHLQVQQYDTLRISALGYKKIEWAIPLIINPEFPPFFQIKLEDISYLLDEVEIYALGTWDEFKDEFLKTKLTDKNPISKNITNQLAPYNTKKPNVVPAQYRPKREGKMGVVSAIFAPTDFLHNKLSKSEKSKKKLSKIIRNEGNLKKISAKYNAEIVSDATGLKGDELLAFMEFSGSHINVTANTSDYSVMKQILFWFEKYKEKPTKEE